MAEIDQATPVHDIDDAVSAFGDCQMSLETLDFQIANGLVRLMNLAIKKEKSVGRRDPRKEHRSPSRSTRSFRFMTFRGD